MPTLRKGDKFLVDLVEADEVEMVREGCRAAEVWRVSELRSLDGTELREAVKPNGALERLVGKGKAGKLWGEVVRRVAQVRGGREDVMGRRVRTGAGSRCSKPLGAWERPAVSDWSLAAWTVEGVVMLGIPQSGPGSNHVECRQLARVGGQLPKWMNRGPSQSRLRRQLWKVEEATVEVQMTLDRVWDTSAERWRVGKGGVWPVEASCVVVEGEERWVLDELPAELSEQAYMWQWEHGVDGNEDQRHEWQCSGWRPGAEEEQGDTVDWTGNPWEQQEAGEDFAEGAEQQLLGEGHSSLRDDSKWQSKLAQARVDGAWGALDVYSDGGADGAGTPAASAEYGWLVGGTDEDSLEVWAEGAARVGGLPEEMDSTRAELLGAYAVLHKVRQIRGRWGCK